MDVFRGVKSIPLSLRHEVVSIGNFDGVHLAHRHICRVIREEADRRGGRCAVFTFDPHPLSIVAPDRCPALMTTLEEKLVRLEEQGLDAVIVQPFTFDLAHTPAPEFVERVIREGVRPELVAVGFNFRFGQGRAGDVSLLREEGGRLGMETRVLPPFFHDGRRVSSTEIRRLLREGQVEEARHRLGQCHMVEGPVTRGDGRGRQIGFPTANVEYPPVLIPANGVYACRVQLEGRSSRRFPAVTNVGERPTFGGRKLTMEAHLIEGGQDLYGRRIRVEFVSRLREEQKFTGPESLIDQIRADVEKARERLRAIG